ncbi:alpha/beta hydrolase family protein [Kordiimonas pumila]|uniref:Alpha/beta hydrolase family protein n=1 Tax=Kordiimonas pumila TaxID=2161677 RepID=A0ABV7D169_9PROT|nr:hypothetical protein [Kordiimonas pumila]
MICTFCAVLPFYFFPIFSLPEPTGSYAVGMQEYELVDESRKGVLGEDKDTARRIKVRIWYPAKTVAGLDKSLYWSRAQGLYQGVSLAKNFGEPAFIYMHLSSVGTNSYEAAPIATTDKPFPFVVFSHGFWSYLSQNTALMEQLASHGYVVASMSHIGDSSTVLFSDGTKAVPYFEATDDETAGAKDDALVGALTAFMGSDTHGARVAAIPALEKVVKEHRLYESFEAWRDDMLFVTSSLRENKVPARIVAISEHTDFSKIGAVGMSFGGTMAATFCHIEDTCVAAVNLDGENFDFSLYDQEINAALLMVLTDQPFNSFQVKDKSFNPTDYAYEKYATMGQRADIYRMHLRGMRHLGLMDLHLLARSPFRASVYGGIGREKGIAAINEATLEFFDKHLRAQQSAFPTDVYAAYPEMVEHDPSGVARWWADNQ